MKPVGTLVFAASAILLAYPLTGLKIPAMKTNVQFITQDVIRPLVRTEKVGVDDCTMCIDFAGKALNELLDIILQGGVVGGCSDLCSELASKTSKVVGDICVVLCTYIGVEEFIKIVKRADLDPIYYCELIPVCPINDHGDAKFISFTVAPKSGPQGMFAIAANYVSKNGTGVGQFSLAIDTIDHIQIGQRLYNAMAPAGNYVVTFQLNAMPDPDCEPAQEDCEQWLPGNYTVKIAICNGECGSKHPHSAIYDKAQTTFTITN